MCVKAQKLPPIEHFPYRATDRAAAESVLSIKSFVYAVARSPIMAPLADRIVRWKNQDNFYNRRHPFDVREGVDTAGYIQAKLLFGHDEEVRAYAGCSPSALRAALETIPNLDGANFLDLGCGKGRALLVARAFPFASLTGIELSPYLAKVARANADIVKHRTPGRPIEIVVGDASAPQIPDGDVVIFLLNSFGRALVDRLAETIAAADARAPSRRIFMVAMNPVHGAAFDARPELSRWFAGTMPYAPEEIGFSPDVDDAVIIWANAAAGQSPHRADHDIVIVKPDWRCALKARA